MGDVIQGDNFADWYGLYHLNKFIYPLTPITNDGYSTLLQDVEPIIIFIKLGCIILWINIPYWLLISVLIAMPLQKVGNKMLKKKNKRIS